MVIMALGVVLIDCVLFCAVFSSSAIQQGKSSEASFANSAYVLRAFTYVLLLFFETVAPGTLGLVACSTIPRIIMMMTLIVKRRQQRWQ